MNTLHKRGSSDGIAMVEAAIALVILAGLVGMSAYVIHRHTATTASTTTSAINAPAGGTTESIGQLTANDATAEQQADKNADSHMLQDATSANTAISNVGGAYNESAL